MVYIEPPDGIVNIDDVAILPLATLHYIAPVLLDERIIPCPTHEDGVVMVGDENVIARRAVDGFAGRTEIFFQIAVRPLTCIRPATMVELRLELEFIQELFLIPCACKIGEMHPLIVAKADKELSRLREFVFRITNNRDSLQTINPCEL